VYLVLVEVRWNTSKAGDDELIQLLLKSGRVVFVNCDSA